MRKLLDVFLLSLFPSLVCTEERLTLEDFCLHDPESVFDVARFFRWPLRWLPWLFLW